MSYLWHDTLILILGLVKIWIFKMLKRWMNYSIWYDYLIKISNFLRKTYILFCVDLAYDENDVKAEHVVGGCNFQIGISLL